MQISKTLRALSNGSYGYYCPGCEALHSTTPDNRFIGSSLSKPTFAQTIKVGRGRDSICRHTLIQGQLCFSHDSRHKLKGKTVALPDLPVEYQDQPRA